VHIVKSENTIMTIYMMTNVTNWCNHRKYENHRCIYTMLMIYVFMKQIM